MCVDGLQDGVVSGQALLAPRPAPLMVNYDRTSETYAEDEHHLYQVGSF